MKRYLTFKEIANKLEKETREWLDDNFGSDEKIKEYVKNLLEPKAVEIIFSLFGLRKSWGNWEISDNKNKLWNPLTQAARKYIEENANYLAEKAMERIKNTSTIQKEIIRYLAEKTTDRIIEEAYTKITNESIFPLVEQVTEEAMNRINKKEENK